MDIVLALWISLSVFASIVWGYSKLLNYPNKMLDRVRYSQSHIHQLVSPLLPRQELGMKNIRETQSSKHELAHNIRVIIMDDMAYWIKDNTFFVANMTEEGMVDKESTRIVDTMAMDRVQLDKMMFIIDKLREGLYDDRGGSGNK